MKAVSFLQECRAELQKVQWPAREEVVNSTIIVLITVMVFSIFLFVSDSILVKTLKFLWNLTA
jgi:preprotein translocase subunit SecE